MRNTAWLPLAIATCLFIILAMVWISAGDSDKPPIETGRKTNSKFVDDTPKPLFDGWPKPAFSLVVSGEAIGYLEPCGCDPTHQTGGLARRATLFKQLKERGWPVAGIDLGASLDPDRADRSQSKHKFDTMAKVLDQIGYKAIGLGFSETLLERSIPTSLLNLTTELKDLKFVSGNLDPYKSAGGAEALGTPVPFHFFEVGGKKVAVTCVVLPSIWRKLFGSRMDTSMGFVPPEDALKAVLPKIAEKKPDLTVLLLHTTKDKAGSVEIARGIIKNHPEIGLVVTTGSKSPEMTQPKFEGTTPIITLGQKGKHVGVFGFFPDEKGKNRLRYQDIKLLKEKFEPHEMMTAHMQTYQQALKDAPDIVAQSKYPRNASFVGAETCGQCHKKAYAKWKSTGHAKAYAALATGHAHTKSESDYDVKNWVNRQNDPECLTCHVTGWLPEKARKYPGGFDPKQAEKFKHLLGNQCENCHGAGSEHSKLEFKWLRDPKSLATNENERLKQERLAMRVKYDDSKGRDVGIARDVCAKCHDGDNSPNFDFKKYWPKVEHRGKD